MKKAIINGQIITPSGISGGWVEWEDGRITATGQGKYAGTASQTIDAEGLYVSPGFIDIHTHGAGGADFMDGTVEAYLTAARMHASHGTTTLCPTTLTSTDEALFESFETYRKAVKENHDGAQFAGMHLEGPYFSPLYAGAQDPRYLKNPRPEDYMKILERCPDLARWSFAPELDGAAEFAAELRRRGIVASIGHTNATFGECDEAFKAGATLMTHFYSCMSTVSRRNAFRFAGTIEYGYWQDGIATEIISDGIHVPQDLLRLMVKIKGVHNIILVTDSMRAAGMPEGKSILGGLNGGQEVIVEDGVAKLLDRTAFAGSVATADRCVRTMYRLGGVSLQDAVSMMTLNPARIMKLDAHKGSLSYGKDADIIIFNDNIEISKVIIAGDEKL